MLAYVPEPFQGQAPPELAADMRRLRALAKGIQRRREEREKVN